MGASAIQDSGLSNKGNVPDAVFSRPAGKSANAPMRNIILFEPDPFGHRMIFIRYIVEAMARRGGFRATLLTSPRAEAAPWVRAMADQLRDHLSLYVVEEPALAGPAVLHPKLRRQWAATNALRSTVTSLRGQGEVDYVFVPFIDDYCLFPFALHGRPFGATPWGGIAIRPRFHLARMGAFVPRRLEDGVEGWAYRRLLRSPTLDSLFSIDPYLAPFFGDERISTVCDPADIAALPWNRAWLSAPDEAVVLLVYGYIDHRKAVDKLLTAAADPRVPDNLTVALVGAQDPEMAPVLAGAAATRLRQRGRLIEVPRRVSDEEEASAFARADIVWGYYPGSYCSSGAMVRAGQTGRPLLTTREGLVGRITAEQKSGLIAPEGDAEVLLEQLVALTEMPELRQQLGAAGLRRFATATGAAFGDQIVEHLDRALNSFDERHA